MSRRDDGAARACQTLRGDRDLRSAPMAVIERAPDLRAEAILPPETIENFRLDGAVLLKGYFRDWVETLRAGMDRNLAEPGPYQRVYTPKGGSGRFVGDYCNWARIPEYRRFVFESPAARIAQQLMGSRTVRIFHEHVLIKEPGTREPTPWHHDQPYYCVDGEQN